jgi:hypothetical protein
MQKGTYLRAVKPRWRRRQVYRADHDRELEKTFSQLRIGVNLLNRTREHYGMGTSVCPHCAQRETRDHYLLECIHYTAQRDILKAALHRAGVPGPLTPLLLLGEPDALKYPQLRSVRAAVSKFIKSSRRFTLKRFL